MNRDELLRAFREHRYVERGYPVPVLEGSELDREVFIRVLIQLFGPLLGEEVELAIRELEERVRSELSNSGDAQISDKELAERLIRVYPEFARSAWTPGRFAGELDVVVSVEDVERVLRERPDLFESQEPGYWRAVGRRCPDGGVCHHDCGPDECFRVKACEPLSGVYPDDEWPETVRREYRGHCPPAARDDVGWPEDEQPCGHPRSAIVSTDEGTHYCGECVKEDKKPEWPAFNHTRGDSPLHPCEECQAAVLAYVEWLEGELKRLRVEWEEMSESYLQRHRLFAESESWKRVATILSQAIRDTFPGIRASGDREESARGVARGLAAEVKALRGGK
jgi:hypothetical protein